MLTDDELKRAFENSVKLNDTAYLLFHLIEISNCFRRGIASDERMECYLRGKAETGFYLRDLFLKYAPEIYSDLLTHKEKI